MATLLLEMNLDGNYTLTVLIYLINRKVRKSAGQITFVELWIFYDLAQRRIKILIIFLFEVSYIHESANE